MIVLKKTYEKALTEINELENEVNEFTKRNVEQAKEIEKLELQIKLNEDYTEVLVNKNCMLNTQLVAKDEEVKKLMLRNAKLASDSEETINELKAIKEELGEFDNANKLLLDENKKLKDSLKVSEFCLNDCKKDNNKLAQKIMLNYEIKRQIENLVVDSIDEEMRQVLLKEKVNGKKVWDLIRLLG